MKRSDLSLPKILVVLVALTLAGVRPSAAQNPTPDERVASIKASLAQSREALKSYEWIETTVTTVKGEEKYRAEYKCYYGADGKLHKVVIIAPPEPPKKK